MINVSTFCYFLEFTLLPIHEVMLYPMHLMQIKLYHCIQFNINIVYSLHFLFIFYFEFTKMFLFLTCRHSLTHFSLKTFFSRCFYTSLYTSTSCNRVKLLLNQIQWKMPNKIASIFPFSVILQMHLFNSPQTQQHRYFILLIIQWICQSHVRYYCMKYVYKKCLDKFFYCI